MELLHKFGFEPILFGAQIVNFLLLFWVLKKFLYKPILKMLEERQHKVEQGLKNAVEADKRLQDTIEKETKILKQAHDQARKLMDDTKVTQEKMLQEAEEATQQKVDTMLKEAKEQISQESAQAEKRLTTHVSTLAVQILQGAIVDLFGEKEQEIIMKNAIKKLQDQKVD